MISCPIASPDFSPADLPPSPVKIPKLARSLHEAYMKLTTSIRQPKLYVNFISIPRPAFFGPKTASGPRRYLASIELMDAAEDG